MTRRANIRRGIAEVSVAGIEVRRLLPVDAALYREIRLEALNLAPEAFGSTFARESVKPLTWFAARLEDAAVFGAFAGGNLLGTAGFFRKQGQKEAHKGALWGMYVRPGTRKAGVGKLLAEAVIEHARQRVELIQLTVVSGNKPARRLYDSLGFSEYGIEKNSLKQDGRYWDEVLMAKSLLPDEAAQP
jgi:ribosomal protein S18 acetylase RimI-like enzyme